MQKDLRNVILESIKHAHIDRKDYPNNSVGYLARITPFFLRIVQTPVGDAMKYTLDAHAVVLVQTTVPNNPMAPRDADMADAVKIWNAMQRKYQNQERARKMTWTEQDWHNTLSDFIANAKAKTK